MPEGFMYYRKLQLFQWVDDNLFSVKAGGPCNIVYCMVCWISIELCVLFCTLYYMDTSTSSGIRFRQQYYIIVLIITLVLLSLLPGIIK